MSISKELTSISAALVSDVLRKDLKAWYLSRSNSFDVMSGGNKCLSLSKRSSKISVRDSDISLVEKARPFESDIAGPSINPKPDLCVMSLDTEALTSTPDEVV
jgi:hypothetical protein